MKTRLFFAIYLIAIILFGCNQADVIKETDRAQENVVDGTDCPDCEPGDVVDGMDCPDCESGNVGDEIDCDICGAISGVVIDDGKVHFCWRDPIVCFAPISAKDYPDKIEIYISENEKSNFRKLIEIKYVRDFSYTVDNLQNDKPYYFYTVLMKEGFESYTTNTIMVVPNKRKEFETLLVSDGNQIQSIWNVSVAQQKNKIAYQEIFGERYSDLVSVSSFRIVISNMDGSEREWANTNTHCFSPCWSPANDKIAFHTQAKNEQFNSKYYYPPSQIALYDYETKTISQLTHDDECNLTPVFSENGTFLLFQSTKNAPDIDLSRMELIPTNIWLINLKTLESLQVTDISKTSLVAVQRPYWIDNDRFLFHGIYPDGKRQLFESSVSEKQINPLLESQWNDYVPSLSPDRTKIAFVSDRSGMMEQVWIYHMDSKKYTQITGYSTGESVTPYYLNIEWIDNSTIVFANGNKLIKQKVE